MSISTELKSLERAFLSLPNEGSLPKETLLISAVKGLLQQQSSVTLVGHILATNFEESLNTVQYVERCKAEVVSGERVGNMETLGATGSEQLLRNLKQINEEYKKEIEQTERRNESHFDRIKSVLGLDIDIKTMLQRGPTQRDRVIIENHRQAGKRAENFKVRNAEFEERLAKTNCSVDRIKQKIEEKSFYYSKLLGGLNEELAKLTAECENVKIQYSNLPSDMSAKVEEERKRVAEEKERELEVKFEVLFSTFALISLGKLLY